MSLIEVSTRRRVTIGMATVTVVLFGLIALGDLKVNLLPDLSYPTLTVRTEYSGAAPIEIENLISEPVEEALGVVKNVRRVKSVSRSGQSDVTLEFAWGADMELAGLEVREKLEVLQLPLEATRPQLLRFDPSTEPILRYALMGAGESDKFNEAELKQLRRYADDELKKRLEPVAGVAAVKIGGGLEDEVQVEIDQQKLKQLNLSVGDVIDRLRSENVNVSGGRLDEGAQRFLVRTINQFASVEEIGAMLLSPDGAITLRLRDVASVRQGFRERDSVIRVDGREAVEIAIYKEGDANTVAVAEGVKRAVALLEKASQLPASARLERIDDQSRFIRGSLDEVTSAAIQGGLLSILVIFLFLRHAWSTFVIGLSLPVSIIATFFFMGQFGISLNVMSLGGLALATGMVVDAAIVVLENISRLRDQGMGILESAIRGTREVGMAVVASVLTSVAVFLPLVFVEGVSGQLFRDQALTVTISLMVSLAVSLTLIPMLSSLRAEIGHRSDGAGPAPAPAPLPRSRLLRLCVVVLRAIGVALRFVVFALTRLLSRLFGIIARVLSWVLLPLAAATHRVQGAMEKRYTEFLPYALTHPAQVLGVALLAFAASLMLVPGLGVDLVPQLAQGQYEATLKLPPGTPLARTDAIVREMQRRHMDDAEIATIYGVSGAGTRLDASPTESGENIGRLVIGLAEGAGAEAEARSMAKLRLSAEALGVHDANFARPALLNYSTPLEIEIAAYDLDRLKAAGRAVVAALQTSDRYSDVKSTVEQGQPEIQIRFDQERAAALGLTTRQIADQVVRKVRGEVATRYSFRERKI
ncbi:MAG: efflux RND transporter permease subunit, partial [Xanthomonadales bacterium]|nr:efflux RND transporter permease subunit [Xanthomonadales bacterium]